MKVLLSYILFLVGCYWKITRFEVKDDWVCQGTCQRYWWRPWSSSWGHCFAGGFIFKGCGHWLGMLSVPFIVYFVFLLLLPKTLCYCWKLYQILSTLTWQSRMKFQFFFCSYVSAYLARPLTVKGPNYFRVVMYVSVEQKSLLQQRYLSG